MFAAEIENRSCAVFGEPWGSWHTAHTTGNHVVDAFST